MNFVILTGMSGAGKSTALKMMEDIGFYCVDNLPIPLLEKFVELSDLQQNAELQKVADTKLHCRGKKPACHIDWMHRRKTPLGNACQ